MKELPVELAVDGPAAPPRSNGELTFEAPWEGQVFGMTIALYEARGFAWGEFQDRLIAAVKRWEAEHPGGAAYHYYERWAEALESLLNDLGIVAVEAIDERAKALALRPAGHGDERHEH